MEQKKKKKYGWFSQQSAENYGVALYGTPTGSSIYVTCVTDNKSESGTGWKDIVYVGEVTEYIFRLEKEFFCHRMKIEFPKQEAPYENFPGWGSGERPFARFNK